MTSSFPPEVTWPSAARWSVSSGADYLSARLRKFYDDATICGEVSGNWYVEMIVFCHFPAIASSFATEVTGWSEARTINSTLNRRFALLGVRGFWWRCHFVQRLLVRIDDTPRWSISGEDVIISTGSHVTIHSEIGSGGGASRFAPSGHLPVDGRLLGRRTEGTQLSHASLHGGTKETQPYIRPWWDPATPFFLWRPQRLTQPYIRLWEPRHPTQLCIPPWYQKPKLNLTSTCGTKNLNSALYPSLRSIGLNLASHLFV